MFYLCLLQRQMLSIYATHGIIKLEFPFWLNTFALPFCLNIVSWIFCLNILLKYFESEVEKLPAKLIRQEVCNKEMWKR